MSTLKNVATKAIHSNPHRMLANYPWIESKVKSLQKSIQDIGMWESIIVREHEQGYEMAFGHHRLEAAKRNGLTEIPVIVKDLTDQQMLEYMGRENGEDYSTDYLVMLNTWEGAVIFYHDKKNSQPIDIAKLLGWTRTQDDGIGHVNDVMTPVAIACNAGHSLIQGGYIGRDELADLSVRSAQDILQRTQSRMETLERTAKEQGTKPADTERAKKHVAKGAIQTVKEVKAGTVRAKDVKTQVDINSFKAATESKAKKVPLFYVFARNLSSGLERMLSNDSTSEKLSQVVSNLDKITMDEDYQLIERIDFYLGEVATKAHSWQKKLIPTEKKIVKLAINNRSEK